MPDESHICETHHAEAPVSGDLLFRELRFAEQFTVWALRKWVAVMKSGDKDDAVLQEAFAQARIGEAFASFDYLMRIVAASAKRTIDVRCVVCHAVSLDETIILGMIEARQQGDAVSTHMYLDDWIPPAAARVAFAPVTCVAETMEQGGLRLAGNRDRHLGFRFDHAVH
jgi:predicted glycoside hydrolase/deacetylase ChbG (UPF0249 family)